MTKKFSKDRLDSTNLHPKKHDYYKSGRIKHEVEEPTEITCSVPIQVRINGGEWVDIRPLSAS